MGLSTGGEWVSPPACYAPGLRCHHRDMKSLRGMRSLLWLGVAAVALADPKIEASLQGSRSTYNARGTCLDIDQRLSRSTLQAILHNIRLSTMGSLKLARAQWGSHELVTEIYRILVNEFLGHNVVDVPIDGTAGAYEKLAKSELDVNMELWQSVVPEEKTLWMVKGQEVEGRMFKAFDAGRHAYEDMARSGIYVRPSEADFEIILRYGRFYSSLDAYVLPRLPNMSKMVADHCMDRPLNRRPCSMGFPNPSCGASGWAEYDAPLERNESLRSGADRAVGASQNAAISCKPVLKDAPIYDIGAVENMIQSGRLPLTILHVGPGGA